MCPPQTKFVSPAVAANVGTIGPQQTTNQNKLPLIFSLSFDHFLQLIPFHGPNKLFHCGRIWYIFQFTPSHTHSRLNTLFRRRRLDGSQRDNTREYPSTAGCPRNAVPTIVFSSQHFWSDIIWRSTESARCLAWMEAFLSHDRQHQMNNSTEVMKHIVHGET